MNASQYKTLKALLATPDYSALSNDAALAKLNAQTVAITQPVPIHSLEYFLLVNAIYPKIYAGQQNANQQIAGVCLMTVKLLDSKQTTLDTSLPQVKNMFAALVGGGVITQAEADGAMALANVTVSPAFQATGQDATADDVLNARNGDW